jgi:adenylate cyclase
VAERSDRSPGVRVEPLVARRVSAHGRSDPLVATLLVLALCLPLVGLVSLLHGSQQHRAWDSAPVHFVLFLTVGAMTVSLALVAADAARRRGDARVLLLALGFLTTGGFMALHALGTPDVLLDVERPGLTTAISVGLLLASVFALATACVDLRPAFAPTVMRHRGLLRGTALGTLVVWTAWSVLQWPPLDRPLAEGGTGTGFTVLAAVGALTYAAAAVRFWWAHRARSGLQVVSIVACFALLGEALIGVALTGERRWHAAWWEWHVLVVTAYLLVFAATRREWRDERFRRLYLPRTRQHRQHVSILVSDLSGFTPYSEAHDPAEVAAMLRTCYEIATPLLAVRYGAEVEKFTGDGLFATFNRRGDQPDHALRASAAALALQEAVRRIRVDHPDWPGLRVGVNSGEVVVCEVGGSGYVAYPAVGDTVNVAARLEGEAPVGGVLVGAQTYRLLPAGSDAVPVRGLRLKGKQTPVDAYELRALPPAGSRTTGRAAHRTADV